MAEWPPVVAMTLSKPRTWRYKSKFRWCKTNWWSSSRCKLRSWPTREISTILTKIREVTSPIKVALLTPSNLVKRVPRNYSETSMRSVEPMSRLKPTRRLALRWRTSNWIKIYRVTYLRLFRRLKKLLKTLTPKMRAVISTRHCLRSRAPNWNQMTPFLSKDF